MMKNSAENSAAARSDLKFKGVRKRKWGKWVSEIRLPNSRERIWLGSYDSAEKAARAFDAALFCLRGKSAKFNFPDNPPDIPGGRSLSPPQIQEAAARFANSSTNFAIQCEQQSTSGFQSPSVSTETVQFGSGDDLGMGGSFLDLLKTGSGNFATEYGIFSGFDELSNEFIGASSPLFDYGEENLDAGASQGSFLWNF